MKWGSEYKNLICTISSFYKDRSSELLVSRSSQALFPSEQSIWKYVSIVNTSCLAVFSFFSFWYCASLVFIVTQGKDERQIMKEEGGNGSTENSVFFFALLSLESRNTAWISYDPL